MSGLDVAFFLWLNATAASPAWVVPFARFVTVQLPEWMIVGLAAAFLVGDARVQRHVSRVVLALLAGWLLARLGQHFFPMPRPFSLGLGTAWKTHADSAGFPSTHASVAFAFAFAVAACTRRWLPAAAAFVVASLIGWSRISLGLHFPVDVLAGAAVGGASAWLSGLVPLYRLKSFAGKRDLHALPVSRAK